MRHKESELQIRCVKWFRVEYPEYSALLEHPKNEGMGDRSRGAIAKAEGVQAGVADLILHIPTKAFFSLAIEMKTKTGQQSAEQKRWERFFEAAGGMYVIVRDFEDFTTLVDGYILSVDKTVREEIKKAYDDMERQESEKIKAQLRKLINKQ